MPQLRHRSGDRIQNRYEVRRLLGSGAFGTVYGCRDLEIDVPVAVKELHVLDEAGGEREDALKQFRSEATHLSRLRHPHIVSGHYEPFAGSWRICPICGLDFPGQQRCPDHGAPLIAVTSRHYLVMEYIAGPDLLKLAGEGGGKIPLEPLLRYADHIASALAHIHARGFVHRDIKPENIRLRADSDEAVLLDFGIATDGEVEGERYGTRAQRHTQGGGTVGYAPESPQERRSPDARSDIHAFGMTLYHLLTAKDPTEPHDLRLMRTHTPRDFAPEIPDALDQLLVECTDMDARKRPQNGAELLARLENLNELSTATQVEPGVAPLLFRSGHRAHDVAELAPLLDAYPAEAAQLLYNGELENWLAAIGAADLAAKASDYRYRYRGRPKQGLEAFAQATGLVEPPLVDISSQNLNFGSLTAQSQKTLDLRVENRGRGHLFGLIRASHPAISTYGEWDGNRAKIPVTFDANRLRPGKYTGEITLDSSAGERVVPFIARVTGPSWLPPFFTTLFYGAGGMVAGGLLRTVPFMSDAKHPGWGWLSSHAGLRWPHLVMFGATLGCILFVWVTLESIVRRSCALWLSMGVMGTVAMLAAMFFGGDLLLAGDAQLHGLTHQLVGNFAAGGWMMGGALLGAGVGSLIRVKDLITVRLGAVLLGWVATGMLVYLALAGVFNSR